MKETPQKQVGKRSSSAPKRCSWCGDDAMYQRYHDEEWGVPVVDSQALFAKLVMEGMQAGLSWITVLRKREHMRSCFYGFDPYKLARYGTRRVDTWMQDPGLIRNRAKLTAMVHNAQRYKEVPDFARLVWQYAPRTAVRRKTAQDVPAHTLESKAMSRMLKQLGFKFVGPTICYAFMQSMGLANDHTRNCHRYQPCEAQRRAARQLVETD